MSLDLTRDPARSPCRTLADAFSLSVAKVGDEEAEVLGGDGGQVWRKVEPGHGDSRRWNLRTRQDGQDWHHYHQNKQIHLENTNKQKTYCKKLTLRSADGNQGYQGNFNNQTHSSKSIYICGPPFNFAIRNFLRLPVKDFG